MHVVLPVDRCNGDSMHHVSKGVMIIRVEDTEGFVILGNTITDIKNLSPAPFSGCTDFHLGASTENSNEQQGGNIRAISVSAVTGFDNNGGTSSLIKENTIVGASSANANIIIGIDIQGDSNRIEVDSNSVDLIGADNDISDSKRSYFQRRLGDPPKTIGVRMRNRLERLGVTDVVVAVQPAAEQ